MKLTFTWRLSLLSLAVAAASFGQESVNTAPDLYVPLTLGQSYAWTLHQIMDPGPLAVIAGAAALDHAQNSPARWGLGSRGFAERTASHFARVTAREDLAFGIRALDHEDPRYFRSRSKGAWRRARYAASRTFVARSASGGDMPAYSTMVSSLATPFIAQLWRPEPVGAGREFRTGGIGLGISAAGNLCQEFWPDVRKKLHRQARPAFAADVEPTSATAR